MRYIQQTSSSRAIPTAMNDSIDDYNYTYSYDLDYGDIDDIRVEHSQTEPMHIFSVVIYIISFMLGVIGNGAVIWVMAFKCKKRVNSVWLLNLAIADFVFVLFLPFFIDYIMRDFHWEFGVAMCKINSFVSVMNMYASVLFLTVLSIDRYVSVVHLNWCQKYRTVNRAWFACGCIWGLAATLSSPALIFRDTMTLDDKVVCFNNFHTHDPHIAAMRHITIVIIRTTVGFLLPLTAISVTGILLIVKMKQSGSSVQLSSFSKTVTAVILAFFLCWTPFHTFSLMELTIHSTPYLHNLLKTGFPLATSLGFFNSCVNPLLYMFLTKKVRNIIKQACLDITKNSLREFSQSISATEIESVAGVYENGVHGEHVASSTI